ncbi:hypothetical protein FisN_32Lh030 [Fistulifera solaris]|jgi:hypothetical protein|uniref:Uncharacterized protein n=1 Tax=Fistulifera solaris TaxID=1519565 RepID=A0A1Z5KNN9_FISSO|nr:hypothetical protein FisN_32Lh030 [Fistulifera solaris]|eukprot:GAX27950.1 hypothetical protein FisN_32Lh030 [Fistulifera solaris]
MNFSFYFQYILPLCLVLSRAHAFYSTKTSFRPPLFLAASNDLDAFFSTKSRLTVEWQGWTTLRTGSNQRTVHAAVLTVPGDNKNTPRPALVLPLEDRSQQLLLQAAHAQKPLTPLQLLRLNAYAINRDNGLFDQLPYQLWTVDPDNVWKDAAGNPTQYHGGKKEAYQWFLGKDWKLYDSSNKRQEKEEDEDDSLDWTVLQKRMAELQRQEWEMELADLQQQLALANRQGTPYDDQLQMRRIQLQEQLRATDVVSTSSSIETTPPSIDMLSYTSPYDMFRDLLQHQMKAEVIATVLENTSFLDGNLVLGGAIVLRRIVATQTVTLLGERVSVPDRTETYGNPEQVGGTILIVECHADEAIGMSLACQLPCQIDAALWEKASVMVTPTSRREWTVQDSALSVLMEGEALQNATSERALPLRIPRSTLSLYDRILAPRRASSTPLFPTDNPIQSLEQYDALTTQDKVRTLLELSNFEGQLPRPRTVRENPAALDELLLPLIDESVRWQYRMREAQQRGDKAMVETLLEQKSRKQAALEKAQEETMNSTYWTEEANFLGSLRADPTQNEGSYSRFLDRDEWYERQRQEQSKRVKRSQFGSLLDGIE